MLSVRILPSFQLDQYRDHLLALSDESKFSRFGYHIKDEAIEKFVDRIKSVADKHIIFVMHDDDLNIIAAGHISIEDPMMELAFSVSDSHQGHGYGNALMLRCLEWCRNRDILEGYMVCLPNNKKMNVLAKKHGLIMRQEDGETTASIKIPPATLDSCLNEIYASNYSEFVYYNRLANKFIRTFPFQF